MHKGDCPHASLITHYASRSRHPHRAEPRPELLDALVVAGGQLEGAAAAVQDQADHPAASAGGVRAVLSRADVEALGGPDLDLLGLAFAERMDLQHAGADGVGLPPELHRR